MSTGLHDDGAPVFSPDGSEVFWRIWGLPHAILVHRTMEKGVWSPARVAPFSGRFADSFMAISPNGSRLYFGSTRPEHETDSDRDENIWVSRKTGTGWSEPSLLPTPVNTPFHEGPSSVGPDGTLYITGAKAHTGRPDDYTLYSAPLKNGQYGAPVKLPPPFNSGRLELHPAVSPDGAYIVYSIRDAADGMGSDDLYVTFRTLSGGWTDAVNLGEGVNSSESDWCPAISPDGKYLFFVSWRCRTAADTSVQKAYDAWIELFNGPGNGHGADVYWVSTEWIQKLKIE